MNLLYTLLKPTPVRSAKRNAITVLQESTVKRRVRNPPPLNNVGRGRGKAVLKETHKQVAARNQSASETAAPGVRGRVVKSNHLSTDGTWSDSHVIEDGEDPKSTVAARSRNSKEDGLTEILGISGATPERSPKKGLPLMEEKEGISLLIKIPLIALVDVPTLPHAEMVAAVKPGASGAAGTTKQSGAAHMKPRLLPGGKVICQPLESLQSETNHMTPRLTPSGKRIGQPPNNPRSKTDHVTPRLFPSGKRIGRPPNKLRVGSITKGTGNGRKSDDKWLRSGGGSKVTRRPGLATLKRLGQSPKGRGKSFATVPAPGASNLAPNGISLVDAAEVNHVLPSSEVHHVASEAEPSRAEHVMPSGSDGRSTGLQEGSVPSTLEDTHELDAVIDSSSEMISKLSTNGASLEMKGQPLKLKSQSDTAIAGSGLDTISDLALPDHEALEPVPPKKRGRPPKVQDGANIAKSRAVMVSDNAGGVLPKKRGRPPKLKVQGDTKGSAGAISSRVDGVMSEPSEGAIPPKKRGRPPKSKVQGDSDVTKGTAGAISDLSLTSSRVDGVIPELSDGAVPPKKRGRPPKQGDSNIAKGSAGTVSDGVMPEPSEDAVPPKQRGRPPKSIGTDVAKGSAGIISDLPLVSSEVGDDVMPESSEDVVPPKQREQPPKLMDTDVARGSTEVDSVMLEPSEDAVPPKLRRWPPRSSGESDTEGSAGTISDLESSGVDDVPAEGAVPPKKMGHPPKSKGQSVANDSAGVISNLTLTSGVGHMIPEPAVLLKKKGQPPKLKVQSNSSVSDPSLLEPSESAVPKKKRGRPPKLKVPSLEPSASAAPLKKKGLGRPRIDHLLDGAASGVSADSDAPVVDPKPAVPSNVSRVAEKDAGSEVTSKLTSSPRIGWSLRNQRVVDKGIASPGSAVVLKKRGRPHRMKQQVPDAVREDIERTPELEVAVASGTNRLVSEVSGSNVPEKQRTGEDKDINSETTPELEVQPPPLADLAKPARKKGGRPPKLKNAITTDEKGSTSEESDGTAKQAADQRPIGSISKPAGTVDEKLSRPRKGQRTDEISDKGKPSVDTGDVTEADDLTPPAKKKRAVLHDAQESKEPSGTQKSLARPKKVRPIKERSNVVSADRRSPPAAGLVSGSRLEVAGEGAVSLVGVVGGVATVNSSVDGVARTEASKDDVVPEQTKAGGASESSGAIMDGEASVDALTAPPPGKEKRQRNVTSHQTGPMSPPPRPLGEAVGPGRQHRPKKGDVASGEAVVVQKQKQPKRTNQEPEDAQSLPVTSSKDSAVQSEGTGGIDKAESQLAESPETSESTSGSSENTLSTQAEEPSVLGKRGADHSSRRRAQANPCAPGLHERDVHEDSPEIPLQNLDTTIPKKQPACKVKKRKTLESVLTTLLESKLSKNEGEVSPDGGSEDKSLATGQMETGQREVGPSGAAGHPKKDKSQEKTGPVRKRKTLVGKRARGKAEAFKLSVVDEERYAERNTTIRLSTSTMVPPKLKSANPAL